MTETYLPIHEAQAAADQLNADEAEGWSYVVEPTPDGKLGKILVKDDQGLPCGYL
jgi:hypothetical protein